MPHSILLVDDNSFVRGLLRNFLESHPGLEVCGEASDGVEAIEKTEMLKPDLVVLDLSMPRMNGLDAARVLNQKRPEIPLVLFTSHTDVLGHLNIADTGIKAVVSKSEDLGMLVAQIEELLEPRGKQAVSGM
jgi:DNA-binding NarL/FixJ family response regulator